MTTGKQLRLRRFLSGGRSVIVALDHGSFAGLVPGLEHPVEIVKAAAQAGADGILVTPGILEQVVDFIGSMAVLLRIDGCVSAQGSGAMRLFTTVEQASRLGVDGVIVNAVIGSPFESEELQKLGEVAAAGRRLGVPVVAGMLSWKMLDNHLDFSGKGDDYLPHSIAEDVALACRIGTELGADAIKTRYPGEAEQFRRIVSATAGPLLVAGGPCRQAGLANTLELVEQVLQAGASGLIFGRRIWQQTNTLEALRAVCAMVHDDATPAEALDISRSS